MWLLKLVDDFFVVDTITDIPHFPSFYPLHAVPTLPSGLYHIVICVHGLLFRAALSSQQKLVRVQS